MIVSKYSLGKSPIAPSLSTQFHLWHWYHLCRCYCMIYCQMHDKSALWSNKTNSQYCNVPNMYILTSKWIRRRLFPYPNALCINKCRWENGFKCTQPLALYRISFRGRECTGICVVKCIPYITQLCNTFNECATMMFRLVINAPVYIASCDEQKWKCMVAACVLG